MLLSDVTKVLEELAPLRYASSWDNVGLLVGDPAATITRVLVTVDYTADVAAEAVELGTNLVVAYHPVLFAAVKRVPHEALWADAVRRGIALYCPHTALDVAAQGTNDFLADACMMHVTERRPIRPFIAGGVAEPAVGLGRIGAVPDLTRAELVERLKRVLGLRYLLVAGPSASLAGTVAVAAGAGGELLEDAIRAGADVFVTGEVRHHDALAAARRGVTVIATLHSNSERAAVAAYAGRMQLPGVSVATSVRDRDPFFVM